MVAASSPCPVGTRRNAPLRSDTTSAQHHWIRPAQNEFKFNVDASICQNSSCAAVVGRDTSGSVLQVAAEPAISLELMLIEADVILLGLRLAADMSGVRCLVTSDAQGLVQCINSATVPLPWCATHIVNECRHILQTNTSVSLVLNQDTGYARWSQKDIVYLLIDWMMKSIWP